MKDVELNLAKPYARQGEEFGSQVKITFSAVFDSQDKALAFQQNLIQLIREAQTDGQ